MKNSKKLILQRRSAPKRCAYCHSDFYDGGPIQACESCGLSLHEECKRSLDRCPALGCGQPFLTSPRPDREESPLRLPLSELEALDELARLESRIDYQSWSLLWSRARARAKEIAKERGAFRWRLFGALCWIWVSIPFLLQRLPSTLFSFQAFLLEGDWSHGGRGLGMLAIILSIFAMLRLLIHELRAFARDPASLPCSDAEKPLSETQGSRPGVFCNWPLSLMVLVICSWPSLAHWQAISHSKDLIAFPPLFILFVVLLTSLGPSTLAAFSDCQSRPDLSLYRSLRRFDKSIQLPGLHVFASERSRQRLNSMVLKLNLLRISLLIPLTLAATLGPPGLAFFLPLIVAWGAELQAQLRPLLHEDDD